MWKLQPPWKKSSPLSLQPPLKVEVLSSPPPFLKILLGGCTLCTQESLSVITQKWKRYIDCEGLWIALLVDEGCHCKPSVFDKVFLKTMEWNKNQHDLKNYLKAYLKHEAIIRQEQYVGKSIIICATQLADGVLLRGIYYE